MSTTRTETTAARRAARAARQARTAAVIGATALVAAAGLAGGALYATITPDRPDHGTPMRVTLYSEDAPDTVIEGWCTVSTTIAPGRPVRVDCARGDDMVTHIAPGPAPFTVVDDTHWAYDHYREETL